MNTLTITIKYNDRTTVRNQIMDLRDNRIKIQREIASLEDLQFWAPWAFTTEQEQHLAQLKVQVECIKVQEKALRNLIY